MASTLNEFKRQAVDQAAQKEIEIQAQKAQAQKKEMAHLTDRNASTRAKGETKTQDLETLAQTITAAEDELAQVSSDIEKANSEKDSGDWDLEYLKRRSDLLEQFLTQAREEQARLEELIKTKSGEKKELTAQIGQALTGLEAIRTRARELLGDKEITNLDKIFEYIEEERDKIHKKRDSREWGEHAAKEYVRTIQEYLDAHSRGRDITMEQVLEKTRQTHNITSLPEPFKLGSEFTNLYIQGFSSALPKQIESLPEELQERIKRDGGILFTDESEKGLQRQQIRVLENGQVMQPLPEAEPKILANLTAREKEIVKQAAASWDLENEARVKKMPEKELLRKMLAESEYAPEAHEEILRAAEAENQVRGAEKMQEHDAQIKAKREQISAQLEENKTYLENLNALLPHVQKYEVLVKKQENDAPYHQQNRASLQSHQTELAQSQTKQANLPKKSKWLWWGGGVIDKEKYAQLTESISGEQKEVARFQEIVAGNAETAANTSEILEKEKQACIALFPESFNVDGALAWNHAVINWEKIDPAKNKEKRLNSILENIDTAEKLWQEGKYLDYNLGEMMFVTPVKGEVGEGGRLAYMAKQAGNAMAEFYESYRNWDELPESTWIITGETIELTDIKGTSKNYMPKLDIHIPAGWQEEFKLLDNRRLNIDLAAKVEELVEKRIKEKGGVATADKIHIVVA